LTGFEALDIYKRAVGLRKRIYQMVASFPKDEKYRLADQLIRSTRKCPANIAEGYGRFHYQENIQFCRIARGSLCESIDLLNCAHECNYIKKDVLDEVIEEVRILLKMLNGYINYLKRSKSERQNYL
jgi:four helix bundle protein